MDSITENQKNPCLIKTQFLKPFVASIDGPVFELPHRRQQSFSLSSSDLEVLSSKITSTGFRSANRDFISWAQKMEALHEPIWRKAGIFEAIKASTYNLPKNPSLILALVEKWCPETKSFVFPWGEATITLEDVMVLLGFSVLGSPAFAPLESLEMRDAMAKLERGRVENRNSKDGRVGHQSWISSFKDRDDDDDKIEHEAFLTMWLSDFVFPDAWPRLISGNVLPIAVRLARGEKIALAPAVLASLYRDLSRVHGFGRRKYRKRIKLDSLFKLVQVWIWERFRNIRPEAREIQMGEPRIARWCTRGKRCEKNERLSFDDFEWRPYAKSVQNWSPPKFYVEEGKWVTVDDSLDDEFVSFARCLRVSMLVGIGFVEDYYPNRVAMQFGLSQDLPDLVTHHIDYTETEAWDDYNKSLDGLKLYIPSRLATTSVTARYHDWWLKSVSEFLSSEEELTGTFNARNTGDKDNDDVSPKVLPYSQVIQKLGEGFHAKLKRCKKRRRAKNVRSDIKKGKIGDCGGSTSREVTLSELFQKELARRTSEHLRNKRCKRAREDGFNAKLERCRKRRKAKNVRSDIKKDKIGDCGGSTSREVTLSELFQNELAKRTSEHLRACQDDDDSSMDCYDDNITIAEIIKSRKKTGGDASESLEKRSRHEELNNDSVHVQKPASEDEYVAPQEIEPRIEVNDDEEETGSEAEKIAVVIPSDENNSSEPPIGSNGVTVEIFVSPQETRQSCNDEVDGNGSNTEEKAMIDDGTKKEECLIHEIGENQREKLCSEAKKEEEIDERLKQRKLAIEEISLKLEARIMKMEKSLTKIRDWKTKRNQTSTKVST